ncbi:MAG: site-specific DNA-methyltransferase [Prevotella sp.]|nr:site-specific DNA-methyltransferase [Prevotella sp.]
MERPERLSLQSADGAQLNLDALYQIAPSCFTEAKDPKTGKIKRVVNFDILRQLLGDDIVEDATEAYEFNWVGKQEARAEVLRPINKTLRPVKEDSVDWDNTQNLYIEGDNLEVLKLLQKSYLGKVKMIYIDPPYNTGKNLIYKNDFSVSEKEFLLKSGVIDEYNNRLVTNTQANGRFHSDWCSMIYSRLLVCRSMLTKGGIICLTIDDSEIENVTAIMNEVFGEVNHLATIVVKNNPSGRSTTKGASISHEYALFYGADEDTTLGRLPRNDAQIARYKEKDEIGAFEWVNFRKHGGYKEDAPSMYYPIYVKKDCSSFRIPKLEWNDVQKDYKVLELPESDEIITLPIDEQGRPRRWKWGLDRALSSKSEMMAKKDRSGEPTVYIKARMNDEGMLPLTVWDDKQYSSTEYGANLLKKMFNASYFDYPKSLYAVIDSLKIGNLDKESIVLDFFSGSATTAHATMQLNAEDGGNRKYICVQIPEKTDSDSEAFKAGYKNICEIGKERIRRAGKKIKEEHPEAKDLDTGFRVFRVDESNFEDVERTPKEYNQGELDLFLNNVKSDRNDLDLLFGCMLDWGVKLSLPMSSEEVDGKMIYTVNDGDLVACFADKVTDKVVKAMADKQPLRVIFRDSCFEQDADKINIYETFKQLLDWSDENVKNNIRVI